jgi:hypothetical protein
MSKQRGRLPFDPRVERRLMGDLLRRPWVLLLACCVPTVLVTAAVAYSLGGASAEDAPPGAGHAVVDRAPSNVPAASAVPRVVAQPMLPGAQAATSGGIIALVSYAGDTSGLPAPATVFVFARRAGVPMPVAVERYQPSQLPVEVVFRAPDDAGTPLQITARLSLGGGVRLEAGDVEASSQPMVPGPEEARIELQIPAL